jgi:aspartyl/asparaginyl beta-hydroxylase (cupin superfamily)
VANRDPYAGSLRCHLGLVTLNDDKCPIRIDGHPIGWRDGEATVFDETYIHKAMNELDKDQARIAGKALKHRNRAAYYALKYTLLGGILALILS